jgi:hypothetical protein
MKLLKFMNKHKAEITSKLNWGYNTNLKTRNSVDPKHVTFEEYTMNYDSGIIEMGVTIEEPEEWDLCPHYGKSFIWLEDIHDEFEGEEGEPYNVLEIDGKKIAYVEYNV